MRIRAWGLPSQIQLVGQLRGTPEKDGLTRLAPMSTTLMNSPKA
jgi:hypothetical protein